MNIRWRYGLLIVVGLACVLFASCSRTPAATIQSLIDDAEPGATITLEPGRYRENLTIAKPLTLVGSESEGRGVEIVSSESNTPAVAIHGGSDVVVVLQQLSVMGSRGTGVEVSGSASVTLTSVLVDDTASSALNLREDAYAVATQCTFSNSDRNGVSISGNAGMTADDSVFESNAAAGIAATTTDEVILTSCAVDKNGENGCSLAGSCNASMTNVTVDENGGGASTAGRFVTLATIFSDQLGAGVALSGDARLEMMSCDVSNSDRVGIIARDDASITARESRILQNGQHGIVALGSGALALYESNVDRNAEVGVILAGATHFTLEGCTIQQNEGGGLVAFNVKCYGAQAASNPYRFTGPISGSNNTIPGPEEPEGNGNLSCCPDSFCDILCAPETAPSGDGSAEP